MNTHHTVRLRTRVAVLVCISAVVLTIDRCTKLWALGALSDGRLIHVVPGLSLTLVRNPGASLGMGSSVTWIISCLAIAACVVLAVLSLLTGTTVWSVALSLGFSGALGNLIDRVIYAQGFLDGHVVDFLDYGWSVGNVADIVLMVAGVLIVVLIAKGTPFGLHGGTGRADEVSEGQADIGQAHDEGEARR